MRPILDEQNYLNFAGRTSNKIVERYRAKYAWYDECLMAIPEILAYAHGDLKRLSVSREGRKAGYTSENLFRAMLAHQTERTSLRNTIVRIAESETLRAFVRLGPRDVMDYSFLHRAFKALRAETWGRINEALKRYAVDQCKTDVSRIRTDSTVVATNIHYPTDSSLMWDGYRVLERLLRRVRDQVPALCPHRFHGRKVKKDLVFVNRYLRSRSQARQRELKRRFQRLLGNVRRLARIGRTVRADLAGVSDLYLRGLGLEIGHYLPLIEKVCDNAERAGLWGEKVPAGDRIFSIFEEHTELIIRGKSRTPVEFGHSVWIAQAKSKFITDYEAMEHKRPDSDLLAEIAHRHKSSFGEYPQAIAADTGFRSDPKTMDELQQDVETLAVPPRSPRAARLDALWYRFRAGIEGSISVLKRAFRLAICYYRGFKSYAAAVGMAVFCHNLSVLAPRRSSA